VLLELVLALLEEVFSELDDVSKLEDSTFEINSSLKEVEDSNSLESTEIVPPPHATSTRVKKIDRLKYFDFIRPPI
jgi:hypothetical protein